MTLPPSAETLGLYRDELAARLRDLKACQTAPSTELYLMTTPALEYPPTGDLYNNMMRTVASETGTRLVDLNLLLKSNRLDAPRHLGCEACRTRKGDNKHIGADINHRFAHLLLDVVRNNSRRLV